MAQSNVQFKIFADAAAAEAAIVRLEKKFMDLENSVSRVGRKSKQSSDDSLRSLSDVAALAGSVGAGFVSVAGAVEIGRRAFAALRQEIDAAAQSEDRFGKKLVADLALSGDLARGQAIQKSLQNMPGVTQETASAAFFGVRGGAPSLDLQRAQDITQQVAGTQGFIFREKLDQLTSFGELAGKLAEIAPEKSAQDITDLASAVTAASGRNVGQLTSQGTIKGIGKLVEGGKPIEEALALAVRGLDVGLRSQSLADIKKEDMALLGAENVAKLQRNFQQAQVSDLAITNFQAAANLAPDDFVEFGAESRLQQQVRGIGQRAEARFSRQAAEISNESSTIGRLGARFGAFVENTLTPLRELRADAQGLQAPSSEAAASGMSSRQAEEMISILKGIHNEQKGNVPTVNRQAHSE